MSHEEFLIVYSLKVKKGSLCQMNNYLVVMFQSLYIHVSSQFYAPRY